MRRDAFKKKKKTGTGEGKEMNYSRSYGRGVIGGKRGVPRWNFEIEEEYFARRYINKSYIIPSSTLTLEECTIDLERSMKRKEERRGKAIRWDPSFLSGKGTGFHYMEGLRHGGLIR